MEIQSGLKLIQSEVLSLLNRFDDSSDSPLHEGLDFDSYSKKLSEYAYFIIATDNNSQIGFIAYYLNEEGRFAYVPQVVVHKDGRHKGVGHAMFTKLYESVEGNYSSVKLEVLKSNVNARNFYNREGFLEIEDHNERILLQKDLRNE